MKKPVFWISGNLRQRKQSWDSVVDYVKENSGEDPNIEVMFCGINPESATPAQRWANASNLINLLRSKDLFDTRPRIIKVIGLPGAYSAITEWLGEVNGNNILVFWGPSSYIQPGSKRLVSVKITKLYKAIKKEGRIFDHPIEVKSDSDAIRIVQEIASECKKEIDAKAARRMIEMQGKNLDILENSINKLSAYQTGKKITVDDVEACCFDDYSDDKIWEFLDHLDNQQLEPALDYLYDFYEEGKGVLGENFYGRINRSFGALIQHYQFLLLLKDACGTNLNVRVAQSGLSTFKKTNPTKIKELRAGKITLNDLESRFSSRYIDNNISKSSVQKAFGRKKSDIYKYVSDLYDTIYLCRRNSGNDATLKLLLNVFVLVVCGKLSLNQAAQIRGYRRKMEV